MKTHGFRTQTRGIIPYLHPSEITLAAAKDILGKTSFIGLQETFDSDVDQQMAVMNNIEILESSGNLEAILDALGDGGVGSDSQDSTRSGQTEEEISNNPDDEEITLGSQDSTRSAVSACTEEDMSVDSLQDELVEVQDVEIDESNDQQQQTTCSINPSADVSSSASSPSTSGSTADDEMEVESGQEV